MEATEIAPIIIVNAECHSVIATSRWKLPIDYPGLLFPEDLQNQIDVGLPLTSIQTNKIEQMFKHSA
ncbi:hypothetical protein MNQ98_07060 [Paenibacillus sp. N3/727]|uniref:hypothetical protein n=1 Tax=Paenibacillus sp. N3/727 TaxID=2925845 RepID=UPI001F537A3E|nr:hypothetical protein [Paenibacillus sp. N3/727]UNK19784.1 hypothetical protein MNQ98_07060 [Paenibacillus sp. N3/727]